MRIYVYDKFRPEGPGEVFLASDDRTLAAPFVSR